MSSPAATQSQTKKLAFVITIGPENRATPRTISDLRSSISSLDTQYAIVLVRNGRLSDDMEECLDAICFSDTHFQSVGLHETTSIQLAMRAGFNAVNADAYISISADGTDDVQSVPKMIAKWLEGSDCVLCVRECQNDQYSYSATDYCLLDRSVVQALQGTEADDRSLSQQTSRLGFKRSIVGMESSWSRKQTFTSRTHQRIRAIRMHWLHHSRTPIRAIYWSSACISGIASVAGISAALALMNGVSSTMVLCGLVGAILSCIASVSISLIVIGEYLYTLMQNGPSAKRYAVVHSSESTQSTEVSYNESDVLQDVEGIREQLRDNAETKSKTKAKLTVKS
jgi:hypothetical protein